MKLYTANFDADRPSTKALEVPLNSNYAVGVKVTYGGRTVPLTTPDISMDNEAPYEILDDNTAVFQMTSPSSPSHEEHDIKLGFDSDIVWAEYHHEGEGNVVNVREDIPQFDGATFYAPDKPMDSLQKAFATPFAVNAFKADDTSPTTGYPIVYIYTHDLLYPAADPAWGSPVLSIALRKTAGKQEFSMNWSVPNETYTEWTSIPPGTPVTFPKNCYIYAYSNMASSVVRTTISAQWTERIQRQFDLHIDNEDKGLFEGYGDKYIIDQTATLSGTYADGSDFSFTVPVVEEPDSSDSELIGG